MDPRQLIITCEHGGNRVPREYAALFARHQALLNSHRGYDIGALGLARLLAGQFDAELHYSTTTRLLVDLNRSLTNHALYSPVTRSLPGNERRRIIERYYNPYRNAVERSVRRLSVKPGGALHISVHTFTPELDGNVRQADIGLLYDPRRRAESEFCRNWRSALRRVAPELRVRFNYPYRGVSDGLTTQLRQRHSPSRYLGIELELNQLLVAAQHSSKRRIHRLVIESLTALLGYHQVLRLHHL